MELGNDGRLVFFVGGAGAGKTTLAKAVAAKRGAALFDMDTLLRPAAEALMTQAGLDPTDRDSAAYKKLCRDLGYKITMDAALENLSIGNDAFVIGPFTKELADPGWIVEQLSRLPEDTRMKSETKVVVVHLKDETAYRDRIQARSSDLDRWKLEHWDEFRQSLTLRRPAWEIPEGNILYVDNTELPFTDNADRIERFIFG
ncbi:AAA family ATPase [Cohnella candidum]|uniref:AAA family ATPase n=1 Tax=Cohnella candidum TaxID=2674991 RepID=UPI001F1510E0|nr:AAA family ATPase [Cohnella candidum]